jgi:hypothetical protein
MAGRGIKGPRELAARALCQMDGHPENIVFEGKPMWESYLPQVDAVLRIALSPSEFIKLLAEEQETNLAGRKGDT